MRVLFNDVIIDNKSALDESGVVGLGTDGNYQQGRFQEIAFYVEYSPDVSAGAVVIETAIDPKYAGTWANLGSANWTAADKTHHVAVTGVHKALRARISSQIVGGTVRVWAIGAE